MELYNFSISDDEINILLHMIAFGQLEIARQMKRLSADDLDIKEYYWHYRYGSNQLKKRLRELRGY